MRVVALLTVRNEALYLARCLSHLCEQGVDVCVIDNDSTDESKSIAESFLGRGVFRIERLPFNGVFDLVAQCQQQEELAAEIDADWFIHHDADEIREAPKGWGRLATAIERADQQGYNAIDFAEFVFIPHGGGNGSDYAREFQNYYYFQPAPLHRVNAWKKTGAAVDLVSSGGHRAEFSGRKMLPEQFVLRHYIGLSAEQLIAKYSHRQYSEAEVRERSWHGWRAEFDKWQVRLPAASELKLYKGEGDWDKSDPKRVHQFVVKRQDD